MFRLTTNKTCKRLFSATTNNLVKVSPAALWHAKYLGIALNDIKGTGPKGHILKSDVLSVNEMMKSKQKSTVETLSFLLELKTTSNFDANLLEKVFNKIAKSSSIKIKYKYIPEISSIQFEVIKESTSMNNFGDQERIKQLIELYLMDSLHLLL